ncbi:MAG: hypothetical protein KKG12_12315 [Gammaproteobacteria bacterium]|jgi:hypothetical protein|uniref:hypothetical protein n=1 Tax=Acidovorax sp. JG5 TaxID=2822718 RepID=UPI001B331E87|nr:hypothetical protein [Acidovorax sp. JG5]MBP3980462.1 hypothetical protein [Acidovorax sp. JG5]MBU4424523.1 hypothetical protein [Gammaproteobacteria bacterium]
MALTTRRVSRHFSAPPVRYPVGPGSVLRWGLLILLGTGGAVLVFWLLQGAGDSAMRLFVAMLVWSVAASAVWHFWRKRIRGLLQWDGVHWRLEIDQLGRSVHSFEGTLWVRLDLQNHLWVCLDGQDGRHAWLWLERQGAPERWGDLRRAVYSRPRPGGSRADEPAAVHRPQA